MNGKGEKQRQSQGKDGYRNKEWQSWHSPNLQTSTAELTQELTAPPILKDPEKATPQPFALCLPTRKIVL